MHMLDDREEILYHLHGIGTTLLQLTDIGAEFHDPRVHRLEHGIRLIASFHAGAGVLMEHRRQSHVHDGLPELVERRHYIVLVSLEIVAAALDSVRPDDDDSAVVFPD